ncbi:MAG TPA: HAD family phosphatase [Lachnospiraceae bacterium]|nr:HAD family phosphatase [Lachnospiraceae bacterium]
MGNILKEDLGDYKAIIFDMDGTLVDSMWMWHQIDIDYLGRFGIALPERLQEDIEGMSFSETAVYFKDRFRLPDSLDKIKDDWNRMAHDRYCHHVPVKEGVLEFLQYLKKNQYKLGVATSNSKELVNSALQALHLHHYFDCIMTACEVNKGKPAPDIYLTVAEKLDVPPYSCLVFEDIIPGILAGKAAGMKVCAVEDAYSSALKNEKIKASDYFISDYFELL